MIWPKRITNLLDGGFASPNIRKENVTCKQKHVVIKNLVAVLINPDNVSI